MGAASTKDGDSSSWRQDMGLAAQALLTRQDLKPHRSAVERVMRIASPVISMRCRALIDMMNGARAIDEPWLRAILAKGEARLAAATPQRLQFLAQGAAGCVFHPPLHGTVEDYSDQTDLVGKVFMSLQEATKELNESKEWVRLDPDGRFGVYPLKLVTVDPSQKAFEETKKCDFTKDGVFLNPSYQLILPKATPADNCLDTAPKTMGVLKQYLYALANLFEGFEFFNAQGLVHGDIKIQNVVSTGPCENPEAFKFIDFGFSFNVHHPDAALAISALGWKPYVAWPVISTFLFGEFKDGQFPRVTELWQMKQGKTLVEYLSEPYHDDALHTIFSESKSHYFVVETWGFIRFQLERVLNRWSTADASPEEMVRALAKAVDMYSLGMLLAEVWGIFTNSHATIVSDDPKDVKVTRGLSPIPVSLSEHKLVYTFIASLTGFHVEENVHVAYKDMLERLFSKSKKRKRSQ